jgi:hypothetical protein
MRGEALGRDLDAGPCRPAGLEEAREGIVFHAPHAYDAAAQGAIERSFTATSDPSAGFAAASVGRALASYRDAWIAMRTEACEATRVRGTQSEALLDARMLCLDARRGEAAALVDALRRADKKTVAGAISAAASLVPIRDCARATTLLAPDPPPPEPARRAEHDALSAELARAKALVDLRRHEECYALMKAIGPRVEALGHSRSRRGPCSWRASAPDGPSTPRPRRRSCSGPRRSRSRPARTTSRPTRASCSSRSPRT